jgi:hypothetical protein
MDRPTKSRVSTSRSAKYLVLLMVLGLSYAGCGASNQPPSFQLAPSQSEAIATSAEQSVRPIFLFPADDTLVCASRSLGSTRLASTTVRLYLAVVCEGRRDQSNCSQNQAVESIAIATVSGQRVTNMSVDPAPGEPDYGAWIENHLPTELWKSAESGSRHYGKQLAAEVESALKCSGP